MDIFSLQAYMRDGLRTSLSNEKFTHFLPLYFGVDKEKTIYLVKKSLSMISNGSTKNFQPSQINEILPKMFLTLMVDITGESIYNSNKSVKMMIYIHRLIQLLYEEFPEERTKIETLVEAFIKDKSKRVKDATPNLGEFLIYLTLTDKFKWADVKEAFLSEQLDRQIFWILKQIPEMEEDEKKGKLELNQEKIEASFKSTEVGFRIVMFLKSFINDVKDKQSMEDFSKMLDNQYCQVDDIQETKFRLELKKIMEIRDYKAYFSYQGSLVKDDAELKTLLKAAIKNSAEKKYHGNEEDLNAIPSISD
jgi:hypothetical protein